MSQPTHSIGRLTLAERLLARILRALIRVVRRLRRTRTEHVRMRGGFFRGTEWPGVWTSTAHRSNRTHWVTKWENEDRIHFDVFPAPPTKCVCEYRYGAWRDV